MAAVLALNAASRLLEQTSPQLSLRLNPFNQDARINAVLQQMSNSIASAEPLLETGIALSPADARMYSLIGVVQRDRGNLSQAMALFDYTLAKLPTEIQSLVQKLTMELDQGNFGQTAPIIQIVARRWAEHWPAIEPLLPAVMGDAATFADLTQRFGKEPGLRRRLLSSLINTAPDLAYELVLTWHKAGLDVSEETNQLTQRLIRDKRYSTAFLLFRKTRTGDDAADDGLVHNGEFSRQPSGNPFDWQLTGQPGVSLEIVERRLAEAGEDKPAGMLSVRFLDSPVQLKNAIQTLRLQPGSYTLRLTYSATSLRTPRPVKLAIACLGKPPLTAATFEDGDVRLGELAADFTVPPGDCPLQQLFIFNEGVTSSWKNRYRGILLIDSVAIAPVVN